MNYKNHKGAYLRPTEQDAAWGLETTCVGRQKIDIQSSYPPLIHPGEYLYNSEDGRVLDEYQLVYLVSGQGIFESSHCPIQRIQSGNIFMLFPGEWHSYRPLSETGWEEYWVGFKGNEMNYKVQNGFFSVHAPVFRLGLSEELVRLYSLIFDLSQKRPAGYRQYMSGIVSHILGIVYSQSKMSRYFVPKIEDMVNNAKIYISANLQNPIYPEQIAEELKVSHSYFCRKFKEYTGFSPARYILEMRIQRSKRLLCSTNLNSQQIAYDCGFESSGYFCMVFRKNVGMSPLEYRKVACGIIME
ncbi:MAG: helix-turn-helix domain-containing protein [Muribaculaceae bacterium]|jgi:AraC-like DNA-binding protein|nr:helix-turn-helix domain-containing protein [Muribaculaceae bacterium]